MDNQNMGVETKTETAPAPQTGVETKESLAPEIDPEAKIAALTAELDKVARDRDNYRTAMLGKKGRIESEELDLSDPIQLQAYVDRRVEDRLLNTQEEQKRKELEEYTKHMARELKEAKLALQNKSQMVPSGSGSGATGLETKTQYFSDEQLADLKKKGYDDAKIKRLEENLKKSK